MSYRFNMLNFTVLAGLYTGCSTKNLKKSIELNIFHATCRPTNALGFMTVILEITTCFGLSCDHLQGDENKNTNIILMCRNYSKSKNLAVFG